MSSSSWRVRYRSAAVRGSVPLAWLPMPCSNPRAQPVKLRSQGVDSDLALSLKLNRRIRGRPPLVLLHGLLGSGKNFQTVARKLSRERDVVIADLRNHGQSPHTDDCSFPAMASDVHALIEHICDASSDSGLAWVAEPSRPARAAVVGHSLGGKVAMIAALARPDLIEALVVADISPVQYPLDSDEWSSVSTVVKAVDHVDLAAATSRDDVDRRLVAAGVPASHRPFIMQNLELVTSSNSSTSSSSASAAAVSEASSVSASPKFRWRCNIHALHRAMRHFAEFPAPVPMPATPPPPRTLFLRGERSTYVQPSHRSEQLRLFPGSVTHTLVGAGHWVHADKPDEFVASVGDFLRH